MYYTVLSGCYEGATVQIVSSHSEKVFNVRLVSQEPGSDLELEFQVERRMLQPILNVGSKVFIKGVPEKTYWGLGVGGMMVFYIPTNPEWGEDAAIISADKLDVIEENPVYEAGSRVAVKGYSEMVYVVVACENDGIIRLRPENSKSGFRLPSRFLYPVD